MDGQVVSGSCRLAEGEDAGEGGVFADGDLPCWGKVRSCQPDEPRSGVDTVEHRGGLRTLYDAGLPEVPAHSARKCVRARDAACSRS